MLPNITSFPTVLKAVQLLLQTLLESAKLVIRFHRIWVHPGLHHQSASGANRLACAGQIQKFHILALLRHPPPLLLIRKDGLNPNLPLHFANLSHLHPSLRSPVHPYVGGGLHLQSNQHHFPLHHPHRRRRPQ